MKIKISGRVLLLEIQDSQWISVIEEMKTSCNHNQIMKKMWLEVGLKIGKYYQEQITLKKIVNNKLISLDNPFNQVSLYWYNYLRI